MKAQVAYATGIGGASVAFALLVTSLLTFGATAADLVITFSITFALSAIVLAAVVVVLDRLHRLRWLWLGAIGYILGAVPYGSFLALTRDDPLALPMTAVQLLSSSAAGGVVGWVCASICWTASRYLMRPNKSFERTREG
jgi:hypothetical protein